MQKPEYYFTDIKAVPKGGDKRCCFKDFWNILSINFKNIPKIKAVVHLFGTLP